MFESGYVILVLGMGLVTYLPRWLPLFMLAQRSVPGWLAEWLDLIPVAILGAILLPLLVIAGEPRHLELFRPELVAAVPTFLFALKTRSLSGTVMVGILIFWGVGALM
jgi:branched-subunit amino acid transport protein